MDVGDVNITYLHVGGQLSPYTPLATVLLYGNRLGTKLVCTGYMYILCRYMYVYFVARDVEMLAKALRALFECLRPC